MADNLNINSVDMNENISFLVNKLENVVDSPIRNSFVKNEGPVFEKLSHSPSVTSSTDSFLSTINAVQSTVFSQLDNSKENAVENQVSSPFVENVHNVHEKTSHSPPVPSSADSFLSTLNAVQSPVLSQLDNSEENAAENPACSPFVENFHEKTSHSPSVPSSADSFLSTLNAVQSPVFNQLDNSKENAVENPVSSPFVDNLKEKTSHSPSVPMSTDSSLSTLNAVQLPVSVNENVNLTSDVGELNSNIEEEKNVNAFEKFAHSQDLPSADSIPFAHNDAQPPDVVVKNNTAINEDAKMNIIQAEVKRMNIKESTLSIECQNEESNLTQSIHKTKNVSLTSELLPSVNDSPSKLTNVTKCFETSKGDILLPCASSQNSDESSFKLSDGVNALSDSHPVNKNLPTFLRKGGSDSDVSMSPASLLDVSYCTQLGNTTMDDLATCMFGIKLNDTIAESDKSIEENSNALNMDMSIKLCKNSLQSNDMLVKSNAVDIIGDCVNEKTDEVLDNLTTTKEEQSNVFNNNLHHSDNEQIISNKSIPISPRSNTEELVDQVITCENAENLTCGVGILNENDLCLANTSVIQNENLLPVDPEQIKLEASSNSFERNGSSTSETLNCKTNVCINEEQVMREDIPIHISVKLNAEQGLVESKSNDVIFHDVTENICEPHLQNENFHKFFGSPNIPEVKNDFSDCKQVKDMVPKDMGGKLDDFKFKVPSIIKQENEEFTDAVEFFKDPSAMQFLEKAGSVPDSDIPRSSLYVKFDPLHLKYESEKQKQDNTILQNSKNVELQQNKGLSACIRESVGNILLSFDSPKKLPPSVQVPLVREDPPKLYTEEELQQKLKLYELTLQDTILKTQFEKESKLNAKSTEVEKLTSLVKALKLTVQQCMLLPKELFDKNIKLKDDLEHLRGENSKLKEDLKVVTEDLQSVEHTFADFHKRYEQCKGMLKTYKDNEECFKRDITDLKKQLVEQEEKYQLLQVRAEEQIDKVNSELSATTKTADVQVAVLRAQLKKSELKYESQSKDFERVKDENNQLKDLYDDLVAKFGAA